MDKNQQDNFDDVRKDLQTRFALLPQEIQDIITSSDYQMRLFELAKKYKLTYEQLGVLELETTMVLLGTSNPNKYQATVASELNKKPEEVAEMVEEIKNQVFGPIHTSLVSLYQNDTSSDTEEEEDELSSSEENMFAQSGVSIEKELPKTTPSTNVAENRNDMLASIENPAPSAPRVLNEIKQVPPSSMPLSKSASASIPVPRAPYAGGAPTMDAVKQPIPMTAKPAGDILSGKLGGTFSVPAKETDHSIKNVGTTPPPKAGGDSYREPIE